jgi:hypothetical protein
MSECNESVLSTACRALKEEFERISSLLRVTDKKPLGGYADPISNMFDTFQSNAADLLEEIEEDIRRKQNRSAWEKYLRFKKEILPTLASELLAVIGGVYIHQQGLDKMGSDDSPSFSDLATAMVNELRERSNNTWGSVLIVGEERIGKPEAEIIRLRFGATDLWNLPFTAHEYGYLLAMNRPTEKLWNLRSDINQQASDPNFWIGYYGEGRYLPEHDDAEARKRTLLSHFCRLFADAFATFFVGPAYVYALLTLRFVPDETLYLPSGNMPSFAQRFVFALETLRRMNDLASSKDESGDRTASRMYENAGWGRSDDPPFTDAVREDTGRLPLLWNNAVQDTMPTDEYPNVLTDSRVWLDRVLNALEQWTGKGLTNTYRYWRWATRELKDELVNGKMTFKQQALDEWQELGGRPPVWAVVNAAWAARIEGRVPVPQIATNALSLLDRSAPLEVKHEEGAQRTTESKEILVRGYAADAPAAARTANGSDEPARGPDPQLDPRFEAMTKAFAMLRDAFDDKSPRSPGKTV